MFTKRYVYNGFCVFLRSTATKRYVYNGLEHLLIIESCQFEGPTASKRYVYTGFGVFYFKAFKKNSICNVSEVLECQSDGF